tara:strand:+ start:187 stop:1224 length:1038 start_codon:yes stop_codon:yes gene_type:complete
MARRYVRDKIGRFASSGGGGSFGGGGKIGKSAKNVKARAAYKNQAGKLREAKKMAKGRMTTKREQKYWNQQLGGAKSGMTRVSNRLTGRGAAKAKRGAANPNKLASSKKFAAARKAPKGSAVRKDAVASAKIKRGERRVRAANKPVVGRKTYKKGPGATERKAAVTGKTMKSTVGRKEKAAYKKQRSKNQPTYRVLAQSKGDKSPSAFIYKDAKAARKFAGSFKNDGKATFKALGGGNKQPRGVKKRRGAKVYDNTTNTSIKMKTVKKNLRRKYPESKAAKRLESKVKRGSAATKRDRILRTAKKNVLKSGGIKSAAFDRRVKRLQKAEDIMTKAMGGSTAWKNF